MQLFGVMLHYFQICAAMPTSSNCLHPSLCARATSFERYCRHSYHHTKMARQSPSNPDRLHCRRAREPMKVNTVGSAPRTITAGIRALLPEPCRQKRAYNEDQNGQVKECSRSMASCFVDAKGSPREPRVAFSDRSCLHMYHADPVYARSKSYSKDGKLR